MMKIKADNFNDLVKKLFEGKPTLLYKTETGLVFPTKTQAKKTKEKFTPLYRIITRATMWRGEDFEEIHFKTNRNEQFKIQTNLENIQFSKNGVTFTM